MQLASPELVTDLPRVQLASRKLQLALSAGATGFVEWCNWLYGPELMDLPGNFPFQVSEVVVATVDPPSIAWLKKLADVEALVKSQSDPKQVELAKTLKLSRPMIQVYLKLSKCVDSEARDRIRKADSAPKPYIFSFSSAKALARLEGKVPNPPGDVHIVLDRAIPDRLKTSQIEAMVEHLINGKPPQDFDHTQVKRRPKGDKNQPTDETSPTTEEEETDDESSESKTTTKTKTQKPQKGTGIPGTKFQWLEELLVGVSIVKPALQKAKKGEPLNGIEWLLLIFHTFLAVVKKGWKFIKPGVHEVFRWYHEVSKKAANFIVPHPHSHSSGSRKSKSSSSSSTSLDKPLQTLAHWVVYVAFQLILLDFILSFVPTLRPWLEWPFRWFVHKGLVILPAEAWAYAQDHLVPAVVVVILLAIALFAAFAMKPAQTLVLLAILVLAGYYGRTWSSDLSLPALFSKPTETVSTPVPEQHAHANSDSELAHADHHKNLQGDRHSPDVQNASNGESGQPNPSTPSGRSGQATAFNGDDNEKTLLESAVDTFPSNRVIKPIPVTPDSSIGQLMAVNRVGDIAVESEYSLRIGQSGQKIASVTPSATGLTIAIEGGLPLGGLLGGGSALGFYWEDVQTIWCMELDTPTGKTSVLRPQAEGQDLSVPIPQKGIGIYYFVLTATNLNQPLVVRCNTPNNLNHLVSAFEYFIKIAQGKYVPVTAMPYLNQGLVLGDENKITALWVGSPADQAGLTFKDHIWAVSGSQPQTKADLEAALQALPSGKQTIEVVTGNDWLTARAKESREHNSKLEPKLTGVVLTVP